MVSQDPERLELARQKISDTSGANPNAICGDLANEQARYGLFEQVQHVDILVNNAGSIQGGGLFDMTLDQWRASWELKVFGYIHMCRIR